MPPPTYARTKGDQMSNVKRQWTQPQLIVLARGTPEESVLLHCKSIGATTAISPYPVGQNGCDASDADGNCGACQARAGS